MNKPITINLLKKYVDEQIKKGNGNKVIMISDDDEGNGFHYLWYAFTEPDWQIDELDEEIAKKKDTIILG